MHEAALVGLSARASSVFGSFDPSGHYVSAPAGTSELDLEQDLFGATRFLRRGQAALLVPLVETHRRVPGSSGLGGGLGDINLSARWDFLFAGQSEPLPGVAVLAGLTFPTGRPPESAHAALVTDATGFGAFQGNVGLAFEQSYGPWLFNLSAIASKRTRRSAQGVTSTLGVQWLALGAMAYVFQQGTSITLAGTYTAEGNATVDGVEAADSGRRLLRMSLAGLLPVSDEWRLVGSVFADPPIRNLGRNSPASVGLVVTLVRAWS